MPSKPITAVEVIGGRQAVRITWADGTATELDLSTHIRRHPALEALKQRKRFAGVTIGEWGWELNWGGVLAVSAATLMRLAREQGGHAMPNAEFRDWLARNGLSLTGAAEALGLSRRTVIYYSSGARPIPRHIALACRGWEVEHQHAA